MLTSLDKALAAAVMAIAALLVNLGFDLPEWANEAYVNSVIAVITPVLVWGIPNKQAKTAAAD